MVFRGFDTQIEIEYAKQTREYSPFSGMGVMEFERESN